MGLLFFLSVFLAENMLAAFPGTISEIATMIWQADNVFLIIIQSFWIKKQCMFQIKSNMWTISTFVKKKKKKVYLKFYLDSWADLAFADIAACCSHHISILLLVHHDLKIVSNFYGLQT